MTDETPRPARRGLAPGDEDYEDHPVLVTRRMAPITDDDLKESIADSDSGEASALGETEELTAGDSSDHGNQESQESLETPEIPVAPIPATPIPPPVGKRMSAVSASDDDDLDFEDIFVPAPRRSAVSSDSPPEIEEIVVEPAKQTSKKSRWMVWSVLGILLIAIVVFAIMMTISGGQKDASSTVQESPTISTSFDEVALLTAAEVAPLSAGSEWRIVATSDSTTVDTKPACLVQTPTEPTPTETWQRTLTTGNSNPAVLNQLDTYATADDAAAAFAAKRTQLGVCDHVPAYILSATNISGLGNEAVSTTIAYQNTVVTYHTVVIVRHGQILATYDIAQNESAPDLTTILQVVTAPSKRICEATSEGCPTNPTAASVIPFAAEHPGWLGTSDLPRINLGTGVWTSTTDQAVPATYGGTGCENVSLSTVAGPTDRTRRTFVISKDSAAFKEFGLDEIIFQFNDADEAATFAGTLQKNISGCSRNLASTTVTGPTEISTTGASGGAITGQSFYVVQDLTSGERLFRVSVIVSDTKVVYLLNNPTKSYGFSDAQWEQISIRAAQRSSQT